MKLACKVIGNGHTLAIAFKDATGKKVAACSRKIPEALPAFQSGDRWIVDVGDYEPVLTVVSVWINPENGQISVTPFGSMRRKPFEMVRSWLIQLDLQ